MIIGGDHEGVQNEVMNKWVIYDEMDDYGMLITMMIIGSDIRVQDKFMAL